MSILDFVPTGFKLRDIQTEMLLDVEANWDDSEVIVIRGDVGVGKSLVLRTIAAWQAAQGKLSAIITPRVALQDQYKKSFPKTPLLKGSSRYKCSNKEFDHCAEKKTIDGFYCGGCKYKNAKKTMEESKVGIFNLQSYYLLQQPRDVVMVDEAHTLFGAISDLNTVRIWETKFKAPEDPDNMAEVLIWLEKLREHYRKLLHGLHKELGERKSEGWSDKECQKMAIRVEEINSTVQKLDRIHYQVARKTGNLFIEEAEDFYRGKKKKLYLIRPKTLANLFNPLGAKATKKMILATATLQPIDLQKLGWGNKTAKFLEYASPFDVKDQPIVVDFVGNMGWKYKDKNIPKLAQRIRDVREQHLDTKGMVHLPYGLAKSLQEHLKEDWVVWHDNKNKEKQLKFFMEKAEKGSVMVASGMSMGVDLAGPDFGWQAIAKILYPSRADQLIDYWYRTDSDWITWLATRDFIQACGRVNRYAGDKAVTYVWDSGLGNPLLGIRGLWQNASRLGYLSSHFRRRVKWRKHKEKS